MHYPPMFLFTVDLFPFPEADRQTIEIRWTKDKRWTMTPSSLQIFYQLLVLCMVATLSVARPQAAIDNQVNRHNKK